MCLQSDILEFRTLHFRLIAHSMGSMSLLMPACKQIKLNSQSKSSHITTLNPLFKTKFFDGWKTTLMPQWFVKRFIWLKFYIVKKRYEFPENMAYGWKKKLHAFTNIFQKHWKYQCHKASNGSRNITYATFIIAYTLQI